MEDDTGERTRQGAHSRNRHAGHLDDAAERVALAAALYAEQADRVRLVQVEGHLAAGRLPEQAVLRRRARHAEDGFVLGAAPASGRLNPPHRRCGFERVLARQRDRARVRFRSAEIIDRSPRLAGGYGDVVSAWGLRPLRG